MDLRAIRSAGLRRGSVPIRSEEADVLWGLIHRMILGELIKIFLIALVALTGLILLAGVIAEAMKSGLGPMQILYAIPFMLPGMLPYTVPTTTLFATCIVYGRLSADNEILALRAAGIHIGYVIMPALLLGTVTAGLMMFLSLDTIPFSNFLLKRQFVGDVEELLYTMLRKDGRIQHPKLSFEIHVDRMKDKKLYDVEFRKRSSDGNGYDVIARAKEAEMMVDQKNQKILIDMRQCEIVQIGGGGGGYVVSRIWEVEIPDLNGPFAKSRASEMTWRELNHNQERVEGEKQKLSQEIDLLHAVTQGRELKTEEIDRIRDLMNQRKDRDNQLFAIHTEFHQRIAIALGCICFALVGCPVGIWFNKSDYLSAFITCFLPIVILYYPLLLCMINLTKAGRLPAHLGMYDADVLLLCVGMFLFRKLAKG